MIRNHGLLIHTGKMPNKKLSISDSILTSLLFTDKYPFLALMHLNDSPTWDNQS